MRWSALQIMVMIIITQSNDENNNFYLMLVICERTIMKWRLAFWQLKLLHHLKKKAEQDTAERYHRDYNWLNLLSSHGSEVACCPLFSFSTAIIIIGRRVLLRGCSRPLAHTVFHKCTQVASWIYHECVPGPDGTLKLNITEITASIWNIKGDQFEGKWTMANKPKTKDGRK